MGLVLSAFVKLKSGFLPSDPEIMQICPERSGKKIDSTYIDLEPAVNMILESPPIKKFYLPFEWISVNGKTQDELAKWGFIPSFLGSDERDTFIYQYMRAEEKDFISYLSSFEHIIDPSPYFLLIRDEIFRLLKETPKNMESFLSRLVLSIISITKNPHTLPSCYVVSLFFVLSIESLFSSTPLFHFVFQTNHISLQWSRLFITQIRLAVYPRNLYQVGYAHHSSLLYRNIKLIGDADESIVETLFEKLNSDHLDESRLFGCLCCKESGDSLYNVGIALIGGETAVHFVKTCLSKLMKSKLVKSVSVREELIVWIRSFSSL